MAETPPLSSETVDVGTGIVDVTVWRSKPNGEPAVQHSAVGSFTDILAAREFVCQQMRTMSRCDVQDAAVVIIDSTDFGAESGRGRRIHQFFGATTEIEEQLSNGSSLAHDIAAALTRAAQTRRVDVAGLVERALAAAAANVGGTESLLAASPQSEAAQVVSSLVDMGTDSDLPLMRRTTPVTLFWEKLDQQLSDFGLRELRARDRAEIETEMSSAELSGALLGELAAELAAVDDLYARDTADYLALWRVAAKEQAVRMGLSEELPVIVSTEETAFFDDGDLEPIYEYAFAVTPLPGCGYTPETFPHRRSNGDVDVVAFVAAERASSRSYRARVKAIRVEFAFASQNRCQAN